MSIPQHIFDTAFLRGLNTITLRQHKRALKYYLRDIGSAPNIALPKTYNEKMFWRRAFDHNPDFLRFCDKIETKDIFFALAPPVPSFETLWVGTAPEDMPDALVNDGVVVKHNAGYNRNWFFAREGYDRAAFNKTAAKWLANPHGGKQSEWAYTQVPPRLLAERVFEADPQKLVELKVHLFGGEVFFTVAYVGKMMTSEMSAIFDASGRRLTVTTKEVKERPELALPDSFVLPKAYGQILNWARQIAADLDYIRVDFMILDGEVYGGEVTPYPTAGRMVVSEPSVVAEMGAAWDLNRSWFMTSPQAGWRKTYQSILKRHL